MTLTDPTTTDTNHDDICHYHCCTRPDLALCGTELDDEPADDDAPDPDCVVCVDLEKSNTYCPQGGICVVVLEMEMYGAGEGAL
jgi:hypothetical protein